MSNIHSAGYKYWENTSLVLRDFKVLIQSKAGLSYCFKTLFIHNLKMYVQLIMACMDVSKNILYLVCDIRTSYLSYVLE